MNWTDPQLNIAFSLNGISRRILNKGDYCSLGFTHKAHQSYGEEGEFAPFLSTHSLNTTCLYLSYDLYFIYYQLTAAVLL